MKTFYSVITFLVILFISANSYSQDKKVTLSLGANLPMGDFGNIYKSGPSAQLGFVFFSRSG